MQQQILSRLLSIFLILTSSCKPRSASEVEAVPAPRSLDSINQALNGCKYDPEYQKYLAMSAKDKQVYVYNKHYRSLFNQDAPANLLPSGVRGEEEVYKGIESKTLDYVAGDLELNIAALFATFRFVLPEHRWLKLLFGHETGARNLGPTFARECDWFQWPQVKMVHAIGSVATVEMVITDGNYTGAFQLKDGKTGAPGIIRFSAANPVLDDIRAVHQLLKSLRADSMTSPEIVKRYVRLGTMLGWTEVDAVTVHNRTVDILEDILSHIESVGRGLGLPVDNLRPLEFIPGIGLKFFRDGRPSGSMVAMNSLAGQSDFHNYFDYYFSPDFSANAPGEYNFSVPTEKSIFGKSPRNDKRHHIFERYASNPVNYQVMRAVGLRFAETLQTIREIIPGKPRLHPFKLSPTSIASVEENGKLITQPKIPDRLIFGFPNNNMTEEISWHPNLGIKTGFEGEVNRLSTIIASTNNDPSHPDTDFRYRLSRLRPGDVVFFVGVQNRSTLEVKTIGYLKLTSTPFPSEFGDFDLFFQHEPLPLPPDPFPKRDFNKTYTIMVDNSLSVGGPHLRCKYTNTEKYYSIASIDVRFNTDALTADITPRTDAYFNSAFKTRRVSMDSLSQVLEDKYLDGKTNQMFFDQAVSVAELYADHTLGDLHPLFCDVGSVN